MSKQHLVDKKFYDFKEYLKLNKIPEWYTNYFSYEVFMQKIIDYKNSAQINSKLSGYFMFMPDSNNQWEQVRYIPQDSKGWD